MIFKESVYTSSAVSNFNAVKVLGEMMTGFFGGWPDEHWQAENKLCRNNSAAFNFIRNATGAALGASLEQIKLYPDGIIKRPEVHAS